MEFKGTPGPWTATEYYVDSTDVVDSNGFSHVSATNLAVLSGWHEKGYSHWSDSEKAHREIPREEQRANARLIAAAPDLLDALIKIVEMNQQYAIDKYGDVRKAEEMACVRMARAAINKALGRE
ncbi:hypothetical protein [Morganella morganii]|uniref:hypothetical protein n=1 Tax=Morganella morganii TaxID=582 RepID=UPI0023678E5F|nr:hypothetical protein [Morganella morganii]